MHVLVVYGEPSSLRPRGTGFMVDADMIIQFITGAFMQESLTTSDFRVNSTVNCGLLLSAITLHVVDSQNIPISSIWSPLDKTLFWGLPVFSKMYKSATLAQSHVVLTLLFHQATCQTVQFTNRLQNPRPEASWDVQIQEGMTHLICDDAPEPQLISVIRKRLKQDGFFTLWKRLSPWAELQM